MYTAAIVASMDVARQLSGFAGHRLVAIASGSRHFNISRDLYLSGGDIEARLSDEYSVPSSMLVPWSGGVGFSRSFGCCVLRGDSQNQEAPD